MPPTDSAAGLSIVAALISTAGVLYQAIAKREADREAAAAAAQTERDKEVRHALEDRLRALEARSAAQDVTNARQDETLRHLTAVLEQMSGDLRELRNALIERPRTGGP